MKLFVVLCSLGLSFTTPVFADKDIETKEFDAKSINALDFSNLSGDVDISPAKGDKAIVTVTKIEFSDACTLNLGLNGKTLEIKVEKSEILSNKACKVSFAIAIPSSSALTISTASGDVSLTGMTGELNFRSASGSIDGISELTKVTARTASGDIELKNMVGTADLKTASGDIVLGFKKLPAKGGVEIATASGSSEITLPRDSKIATNFTAASGRLKNLIGETPNASFKIFARSASGDLTIKKGAF